jgi:hypothetical protein
VLVIRGVNRRVIEIKKCNSDYFDRAFLVVKDEKSDVDEAVLNSSAQLYLNMLSGGKKKPRLSLKRVICYVGMFLLGVIVTAIIR